MVILSGATSSRAASGCVIFHDEIFPVVVGVVGIDITLVGHVRKLALLFGCATFCGIWLSNGFPNLMVRQFVCAWRLTEPVLTPVNVTSGALAFLRPSIFLVGVSTNPSQSPATPITICVWTQTESTPEDNAPSDAFDFVDDHLTNVATTRHEHIQNLTTLLV